MRSHSSMHPSENCCGRCSPWNRKHFVRDRFFPSSINVLRMWTLRTTTWLSRIGNGGDLGGNRARSGSQCQHQHQRQRPEDTRCGNARRYERPWTAGKTGESQARLSEVRIPRPQTWGGSISVTLPRLSGFPDLNRARSWDTKVRHKSHFEIGVSPNAFSAVPLLFLCVDRFGLSVWMPTLTPDARFCGCLLFVRTGWKLCNRRREGRVSGTEY